MVINIGINMFITAMKARYLIEEVHYYVVGCDDNGDGNGKGEVSIEKSVKWILSIMGDDYKKLKQEDKDFLKMIELNITDKRYLFQMLSSYDDSQIMDFVREGKILPLPTTVCKMMGDKVLIFKVDKCENHRDAIGELVGDKVIFFEVDQDGKVILPCSETGFKKNLSDFSDECLDGFQTDQPQGEIISLSSSAGIEKSVGTLPVRDQVCKKSDCSYFNSNNPCFIKEDSDVKTYSDEDCWWHACDSIAQARSETKEVREVGLRDDVVAQNTEVGSSHSETSNDKEDDVNFQCAML